MKKLQLTPRANSRTLPEIEHLLMAYFDASFRSRAECNLREKPLKELSMKIDIAVFSLASINEKLNPKSLPKDIFVWGNDLILDENLHFRVIEGNFEILKARSVRLNELLNQNVKVKDEDFAKMLDSIVRIWGLRNLLKGNGHSNPLELPESYFNVALCSGFGVTSKESYLEKDYEKELEVLNQSYESRFPTLEFDIKKALEVCSRGVDSLIRILFPQLNWHVLEIVKEELEIGNGR